ncbi:MAG: orotidine-5'-phosphate decarboxylase [Actinomycetaceae bacterium]|nr:orotidine-5'-phosphate decarboxylase [Actinomycetaceae bacterium]MDU0969489.1 orotidine-5'-phosphate decarboxylase [Actinomycetaceae bacterium]
MEHYGIRLERAMDQYGHVCVGIDPHPQLLSDWGLGVNAEGLRTFGLRVVEAMAGTVGVVKPQSALFEQCGSAGIAALEDVLAAARDAGLLTILDVKRGDIGSTMAGYARAYLSDDSPLRADAITLSPYLGFGSLAPAIDLADQTGRGIYVLTLTSNPEGAQVQHARGSSGRWVAGEIAACVGDHNTRDRDEGHLGSVGMVIGATVGDAVAQAGIDLAATNASVLAPGVGAQGAGPDQVKQVFGSAVANVLASSSRGILSHGPALADLRRAAVETTGRIEKLL